LTTTGGVFTAYKHKVKFGHVQEKDKSLPMPSKSDTQGWGEMVVPVQRWKRRENAMRWDELFWGFQEPWTNEQANASEVWAGEQTQRSPITNAQPALERPQGWWGLVTNSPGPVAHPGIFRIKWMSLYNNHRTEKQHWHRRGHVSTSFLFTVTIS
jgi:hypothetical protein